MKNLTKFIILTFVIFNIDKSVFAEIPRFVDFKIILNQSEAGKKAQNFLKNKLDKGIASIRDKEKKIQDEEKKIISQKKILSPDEYKKKVQGLRDKVSKLQKERNTLLNEVSKQRTKARNELLKNLNPILKDYMKEKKIRIVLDKKSLLVADENLDITNEILSRLNQKIKKIDLK